MLEKAQEKKKAEEEASKKVQEEEKAKVEEQAKKDAEEKAAEEAELAQLNDEAARAVATPTVDAQDDASDGGSSSGTSTPAEVEPVWITVAESAD